MRFACTAALLAVAFLSGVSTANASSLRLFHTPSKNIGCSMSDDKFGRSVRCDIGEHSWPLPPRPNTQGCRQLDLIAGLTFGTTGKSHFFCAGDTVLRQGSVLRYGHSLRVGRFTCTSRTTGVTCRNRRNGHGLFLSRASYRRF